ncbi:hypothetical protein GCM10007977_033320 [Dactylosporangium sucinum]|uniref:Insertion element IS402-like domain-containing protein n=1 Tax=Dactylosporangium sucinum TaxID=1424081 RepID=A0A917WUL2_9ACTN|nr:hypothetical protein GCM10007977_033320 [Dactylosporangium sucinum]
MLVSGCAWRLVPHDLAPWHTTYRWFRYWSAQRVWDDIHDALRDRVRQAEGRDPQPSAAVLDSQSASPRAAARRSDSTPARKRAAASDICW